MESFENDPEKIGEGTYGKVYKMRLKNTLTNFERSEIETSEIGKMMEDHGQISKSISTSIFDS